MNNDAALEAMCAAVAECPRIETNEETTRPNPEMIAMGHPAYLVCTVFPLLKTAFTHANGESLEVSLVEYATTLT
ncbi:hypothetical protein OGATHE_000105 [Ogataea polymorpha]|uniref:Uncharacterized protein n=1 Tax=Ogataea polymorpha TaxID=460523 RepID=A0A9P8PV14_9ASCO|nr:hypothetical protein OGATHE_000105 [Ogataea polymorpha]